MTTFKQKRWFPFISLMVIIMAEGCKKDIYIDPAKEYNIPLTINYINNRPVPTVTINVNGVSRQVIFDTGSSGLRIVVGAANPSLINAPTDTVSYTYGEADQVKIKGRIVGGYFALEQTPGTSSVRFMVIDSIGRVSDNGLAALSQSDVQSSYFDGFSGIMGGGLGYNGDGAASPIPQLPGNGKYIVEFPASGGAHGNVIINPTDAELNGFTFVDVPKGNVTIPNGDDSWNDHAVRGMVKINNVTLTNPVVLDTGTPQMNLVTDLLTVSPVSSGTVSYGVANQESPNILVQNSFSIKNLVAGVDLIEVIQPTSNVKPISNLGTRVFFDYDVAYDQVNGKIGLRKK